MTTRAAPVHAPPILSAQLAGAMRDEPYPLQWIGSHAVVTLPELLDVSRADSIRAELLSVINRGATALIVDMTASVSCDHSGPEAVVRAYQRAIVSGTQLRLVVSAEIIRRVLSLNGIDRLVSIYPCLEAALAAEELPPAAPREADPGTPDFAGPEPDTHDDHSALRLVRAGSLYRGGSADLTVSVLWGPLDGLPDGTALIDGNGRIALANARLTEMFGYHPADLIGKPVEALIPAYLRAAHRAHRADYARQPRRRGGWETGRGWWGCARTEHCSDRGQPQPGGCHGRQLHSRGRRHPVGLQPSARRTSAGQPGRAAAGKWPACGSEETMGCKGDE